MARRRTPLTTAASATGGALAAVFVMSLFINLAMLASPLYSMQVYDRVLTSRNTTTLLALTGIIALFLALYGVLEYARSGILVRAGLAFESRLRRPLFEAMMRAELDPEHRQGEQVIRDAETLRDSIASGAATVLCDLPWTPIFIALCFVLHPLLGMIALGGAAVSFGLALLTEAMTKSSVERITVLSNEASAFAAAALRNGEAVRGLGMGDVVRERWCGRQGAAIAAHAGSYEKTATLVAMSKFARVAVQATIIFAGAWLAIDRQISPGVMVASSLIISRALAPVEQLVGQWKRFVACRASWRRLEALFAAMPETARPVSLPAPTGHIEVSQAVVVPMGAARPAVRNVSFELAAGESLAIVGASASGKSSLARAIAGVWPMAHGEVRIDGAELSQWDRSQLGRHVGYLPQDVELFAGTVAENIARLGEVEHAAVVAAARAAGAHDVILRLPKGYDTPIGEGGMALSGGMRQRVGLARALYGDPRLLILDEPNSNLDEEGERALGEAVARMREARRTVIVVTHRPQLLAHVDKVLVMSMGATIAFGGRDDVISRMRGGRVAAVRQAA
jgi:PrtD family type I secretion system ABC transporter